MNGPRPAHEMLAYYALGLEQGRLEVDYFPLERARTQELVLRQLAPPPGVVLDGRRVRAHRRAGPAGRPAPQRHGERPLLHHLLAVGRRPS